MSDDTTAALQALMQQVHTLTDKVEAQGKIIASTKKHNDRLLNKVQDDKRAEILRLSDAADKRDYEQRMQDNGFLKDTDGRYRLANQAGAPEGALVITREQARDPAAYRKLKAEAAEAGVKLVVASDQDDPTATNLARPEITESKVITFDDEHDRVRWIRADMHKGAGIVARHNAAEREGFKIKTFRTPDDLPGHARTIFDLREAAHNEGR